jgi:hypothetical protein
MPFHRPIALSVLICAFAVLDWTAIPAQAQPPVIVNDPTRPSPIEILYSSTYQIATVGQVWAKFGDVLCIGFVNNGPQSATGVGLNYAMVDETGTVISVVSTYPTGDFPVGMLSSGSHPAERDIPNGNCHLVSPLPEPIASSTMYVISEKGGAQIPVAAVFASVREIRYADGTVWHGAAIPKVGDTFSLPPAPAFTAAVANGKPRLVAGNADGDPVEITDVFEMHRIVHVEGSNAETALVVSRMPKSFTGGGYCFTFANRDAKAIRHVRIAAVVLDRRGYIVGLEPFDARGPFAQRTEPGVISGQGCTTIGGDFDGDTLMYENDAIQPIAAGQLIFTPIHIDFVDGTHWDNPAMPTIGHMIVAPKAVP